MRGLRPVKTFTARKILILFLILCPIIPNLYPEGWAEIIDRVVAIVNDDIITLKELNDAADNFPNEAVFATNFGGEKPDIYEIKRETLDRLIDDRLMEQEAKKRGISVSQREIDDAIESILKKNSISRQEMIDRLGSDGLSFEKYQEHIGREMKKSRFMDYEIKDKVTVIEDDIKKYYDEHTDFFRVIEMVRVQHILLSIPPNASETTIEGVNKNTRELVERINSGEDFGKLAGIYSQGASAASGGDMGWFKRGEIIPFLETVVFDLEVGEVSGVIKSPLGLHMIKLMDKKEGEVRPFEGVKDEIRRILSAQEAEKELKELLEELRKTSFVKIKL